MSPFRITLMWALRLLWLGGHGLETVTVYSVTFELMNGIGSAVIVALLFFAVGVILPIQDVWDNARQRWSAFAFYLSVMAGCELVVAFKLSNHFRKQMLTATDSVIAMKPLWAVAVVFTVLMAVWGAIHLLPVHPPSLGEIKKGPRLAKNRE